MSTKSNPESFIRFKEIIDTLRSPEGCPWDRKQTHDSLKPYLVEECYEVLEAIDKAVPEKLCEELGDLLLQIMLHARISAEDKDFNINNVMDGISDKLVRRHPHVFGDVKTDDIAEIKYNWHALKQAEPGKEESILAGAPEMMPALAYSQLIQRKAAAVGFDWDKTEDILEKLVEEVSELVRARNSREKVHEFGDILFVLVNLARRLEIDAEESLRSANQRFFQRFSHMEKVCRKKGISFDSLSFEQQNTLWDEAKRNTG